MVNRKKGGKVEEPTPKSLTDTQPLCPTLSLYLPTATAATPV